MHLKQFFFTITIFCQLLFFSACNKKEKEAEILRMQVHNLVAEIQDISHLNTIEYRVLKVVKYKDGIPLYKRSIYYQAEFRIIGSINLKLIELVSTDIEKKRVTIKLPTPNVPKIMMIPIERSRIKVRRSLFRNRFTVEEIGILNGKALKSVEDDLGNMGIDEDVNSNAQIVIRNLFRNIGFYVDFQS